MGKVKKERGSDFPNNMNKKFEKILTFKEMSAKNIERLKNLKRKAKADDRGQYQNYTQITREMDVIIMEHVSDLEMKIEELEYELLEEGTRE